MRRAPRRCIRRRSKCWRALGLLDEVIARGLVAPTFQFWDRPSAPHGRRVRSRDPEGRHAYPFVVQCEQHKIAKHGDRTAEGISACRGDVSAPVDSIADCGDRVEITVETADGTRKPSSGSYLVGADGGRSTVRKALDIEFEGYTFPGTLPGADHAVRFRQPNTASRSAPISPIRTNGPICSRSRATTARAAGARCFRRCPARPTRRC